MEGVVDRNGPAEAGWRHFGRGLLQAEATDRTQGLPQMSLADGDDLGYTLYYDRLHKSLRVGIEIGTPKGQLDRLNTHRSRQ